MDEALDGIVFCVRGLTFQVCDQEGLLEDGGVKDVALTTM